MILVMSFFMGCSSSSFKNDNSVSVLNKLIISGDSVYCAKDSLFILDMRDQFDNFHPTSSVNKDSKNEEPKLISSVSAEFPTESIGKITYGEVSVKMLIDTTGRPILAKVIKTSDVVLNKPSLIAAIQWRFSVARINGYPIPVWITVPFKFRS
jgi:TonB family protein